VSGIQNGSFESFVTERSTALLRTAYLLAGDRGRAEDLLQTALIQAHRQWNRISGDNPATFARQALVTTHTSWLGGGRVSEFIATSRLLSGAAGLPGFAVPHVDIGGRDNTTTALATLPPRLRAVLVLRCWEDLSEGATAAVLGCPVDTVRADTARGLARLGELLGEAGAPTGTGGSTATDIERRLRRSLAERAQQIAAAPAGLYDHVLDGERAQHRNRAGLLAVTAFFLAVVVLVVLTV
jgi:RNA polymerase sigma-70 factor (sigma-E family)